tara:strand:+ start:40 stop:537 length:498 start_codon:yes stop_codon:yes gene_type:complete
MKNILTLLLMFSIYLGFSQSEEITGVASTQDKYSKSIAKTYTEYLNNSYEELNAKLASDVVITLNGQSITKEQWIQGCKIHHQLFNNIKMMGFTETIVYNEANDHQVWSHYWGWWSGKSNKTGKEYTNLTSNFSYKWIDGKVSVMSIIYDPTSLNFEMKKANIKM